MSTAASQDLGQGFAELDPTLCRANTVNNYNVTPEAIDMVLEQMLQSANDVVRYEDGFVSFNYHFTEDRKQIINYTQWRSKEVLMGMRQNPRIVEVMKYMAQIAGHSTPVPFELLRVFKARASSEEGITKLIPNNGQQTFINTYEVKPERADELVDFVSRATQDTLRYVPGFLSANLHLSFDRTKVVNYAQWITADAAAAARQDPAVAELMRQQDEIADSYTVVPVELRATVVAASR